VRPVGDRYVLVHGERRYRAAQALGWKTIPAEVRDISPDEARWFSLIENIQRADLSPIEEAREFQTRLAEGMTQEQLAKRIGKTRNYIAQKLRLLTLPDPIVFYLNRRALTEGHARQLLKLRAIYRNLQAKFAPEWWTTEFDKRLPELEAWAILTWPLLRDIRPEDNPPYWFCNAQCAEGELPADCPPWKTLAERCKRFFRFVADHQGAIDQWVVAGFWWASFVVSVGVSVADLSELVDAWKERFLAAIAWFDGREKNHVPEREIDKMHHWGHLSDLRHSGAAGWASNAPLDVRQEAVKLLLRESAYIAPSSCQPWGFQAERYRELLTQECERVGE
jgi:ParB/RepB/Spo0J family partition protein